MHENKRPDFYQNIFGIVRWGGTYIIKCILHIRACTLYNVTPFEVHVLKMKNYCEEKNGLFSCILCIGNHDDDVNNDFSWRTVTVFDWRECMSCTEQ